MTVRVHLFQSVVTPGSWQIQLLAPGSSAKNCTLTRVSHPHPIPARDSADRRVMNRVSGAALIAIVSLTVLACARTSRHSDSASPSTFLAQLDTTCDFVPVMDHPNPTILANELVQRASRAEFARTETWMPTAVTCVGHEPGYDTFGIVRSFSLTSLDSTLTMKRMILRRVILGDYSGGHFSPHSRVGVDTLLIENTPFGWRIRNPVWNWVTLPTAKQLKWLRDTTGSNA